MKYKENRMDMNFEKNASVKFEDYTKKSLQMDSNPTTMEVVTRTNAVKSLSDEVVLVCPGVSARFLHGFCTVSKRAKGANRCKIGQRVQKLETQNLRSIAEK